MAGLTDGPAGHFNSQPSFCAPLDGSFESPTIPIWEQKGRKGRQLLLTQPFTMTEPRRSREGLSEDQPGIWQPGTLCTHAAFCYSALLHQQLPVIFGTNPVLQQARAQQKLKTYVPPYLLQPFVPINYARRTGACRHTSWLYGELPSLGTQQQ